MRSGTKILYADALAAIGLNEGEVQVYTHLVERGGSTVKDLAARLPFSRTLIYHMLAALGREGLVVATKHADDEWRTVFCAEDPKKMYGLMAAKEKEFADSKNALYEVVPKLLREYTKHGEWPTAGTVTDVVAYARVLEDMLTNTGDSLLSYEDPVSIFAAADIRERHERRRVLQRVYKKVLCHESKTLTEYLQTRPYDEYTEFRVLGRDCAVTLQPLLLAGACALVAHMGTHEPRAVHIEDVQFVTMQRSIFLHLWHTAKPATLAHIQV